MDPLDPADAQFIVHEYAQVLAKHSEADVYPSSVSTLPHSKDVLKQSIRTSVTALIESGQMTEELRDFLEIAYVSLADYIDEELVRLMREYAQAGEQLAVDGRLAREKTQTHAWQVLTGTSRLAGEVARSIARETEDLREEFRALYA